MKSGRIEMEGGPTIQTGSGERLSSISERSVSFDELAGGIPEAKDEEVNEYEDLEVDGLDFGDALDASDEARVSAGRSGAPRPITRNLAGEFDEVAKPEPARDDSESDNEVSSKKPADESVIRNSLGLDPIVHAQGHATSPLGRAEWRIGVAREHYAGRECTVSLLRAMRLEPQTNPSEAALRDCPPTIAGKELKRWKRKLRLSFGTSGIGLKTPPTVRPKGDADPSQIPLPQTPKKNEQGKESDNDGVFGVRTEGTPYFQDSHMVTPRSSNRADRLARDAEASNTQQGNARASSGRSHRRFVPRDDSSDDDNDDGDYYRKEDAEYDGPSDELARQVREVSEMERLNSTLRLELATHRPLAQIKAFSGLHNKSDNSMQWLRTFVDEVKGTRTPPNEWWMAFELSLRDGALHWYRQLPRKTKRQWKLLSDSFIKYYCSQFHQSAKARYYSAKREGNEHVCDYLNRLNGYARNAGVQFEKGGRESKEHVNRFLESCGDRGLERRMCHHRVKDIHELEDIINDILKSEERGSTRETSADGYRRDRHERHGRGYDRRMDDSRHTPRISLAEASLSEMMAELQIRESKYGRSQCSKSRDMCRSLEDSSSEDVEDRLTDEDRSGSDYADLYHSDEHDHHASAANDAERRAEAVGTYGRSESRGRRGDFSDRGLDRNSRDQGPDRQVNTTEIEKKRNRCFGGGESDERKPEEWNSGGSEGLMSSVTQKTWQDYHPEIVIKLLSGERLGWWSAQKFGKRVRMRLCVISERFAKQLCLREVRDHGRCMEIQGFTKRTMATTKRALAKVNLGWNQVYEYELWVMDHEAGVDEVLGTDFMIPAGVRLELLHATARLPDEVEIPLVKTQRMADTREEGPHVPDGPTEVLTIPGHESRDYRPMRQPPANETHERWVRRTKELIPKGVGGFGSGPTEARRSLSRGRNSVRRLGDRDAPNAAEHPGNAIEFEDYARELAFLPDLTEAASTTLDYTGPHVRHPSLSVEQQDRVVEVLKSHERIMISSGNALPPPACGLKAGLIAFSDSPWASPIVIVLKITGVDIRLCIDYKMVNSVTAILEYAMPLVDDLLTDMEKYLWYGSLDAASGFWAVMMNQRARKISAFVYALGHFEWLRMPFGMKEKTMIYQRMIDNALRGFVQPRGGWAAFEERVRKAEAVDIAVGGSPTDAAIHGRSRFEADRESSDIPDSLSAVVSDPRGDMVVSGEADQSSLVPVFGRRSFVDDICFGGESFDSCLETLDRLLSRFEECRISVSFTRSMFVQPTVDFLSHAVSREGLRADAKKLKAIAELSFPKTKIGVEAFLGALNYYSRFIQDFAVYGAALYQVREEDFGPGGDLSTAKRSFTALQTKVADATILKHFDGAKAVHVMLFAND
ncbi:unnamed protein product [Phytophthora fragariaefolia]|uniref:Unnamed protein product n=1 Tax=Phytophthora fragariaefolia TaxID=1490495 RepID=A0A9W6X0B4_9STRA|nr:unnamed protein product [Phytophthora fragariaefolia]